MVLTSCISCFLFFLKKKRDVYTVLMYLCNDIPDLDHVYHFLAYTVKEKINDW